MNNLNRIYNVGVYIRLSREDDVKEIESQSITNQKSLLLQYVKENNLKLVDIYVDDGYSGTSFDRPDFNRLIKDIEIGKINMVITKDMSRLGRDYIETGRYVEKYFPEHNVRYIAVTDNIDTFLDTSNNDIAPFKAIMNDMYAKDISKKIRSSFRAKQKEGKWVSGRCPFGYKIDLDNKNHLIIDDKKANVVKRIFNLASDGYTAYKIACILTNDKVKVPSAYYSFKWKEKYNNRWNSKTVKDILTNKMYLGMTIQNRRTKVNYKVKKVVKTKPSDYIVVENTHEAIIDEGLFYEVQNKLSKCVGRNEKKENHLLDGLLYCGDCGHRISVQSRRKVDNNCYTMCNYYRTYMKCNVCTTHSNNYDKLEKVIIDAIKEECKKYINSKIIKDNVNINMTVKDNGIKVKNEIRLLNEEINKLMTNLDNVYMDKLNGIVDNDQYIRISDKIEEEIKNKSSRIDNLNNDVVICNYNKFDSKMIDNYINKFINMDNINRELVIGLVDKIEIFEDKSINIKFSFNKVFYL